jgi:negative regulator of flagellin synthesis FlgM
MKVGQLDSSVTVAGTASGNKPSSAAAAGRGAAAEPSAKVAISSAGSMMSGASVDGSFDSEKVDRIASAIREGRFTINAEAIADKLLVNARELMGPARSN